MPAISRAQDIIQFLRRKGKPDIELRDCQQGSTRERMKEKQVFEGEPWLMRTANHHLCTHVPCFSTEFSKWGNGNAEE